MAIFRLSELSEKERKRYLQNIDIEVEQNRNAEELKRQELVSKYMNDRNDILPIETKNTDKFPVQEKNTTNNFPIKQKSENNTVTNKKLSEMVQGPSKENNNSQNRFNFRQVNQISNKNENKQLNAKVTTEKEQEQIKKAGGLEYDTNAIKEAMEINKDNLKGNINSSISHVLNGVLEGAKSNFAGVGQSALFPIANALRMAEEVTGKKQQAQEKDNEEELWSNKVLDMADYLKEESQHHSKVGSMLENNITRDLGNISNTVGNMAMSAISNIAIPGSGIMETGVSAGGNSAGETLNEDRSNLIQAIATGTAKGAVEGFTEKITGGNMLGKGSLDDLAENIIGNRIKSKAGKKIASKMYEFGGEILEEQISNNAGYVIDKIINNKDLPSFEQWINEANETTKSTFLTTLALNMLGMGGSTYKDSKIDIKDEQAQKYLNEAQKIIDNENIAENIKNNVTNQYNYKNTILSDLKASNLSNETKNEIQQYLKENNITEEQFNQISETLKQEKMSKEEQSNINSNEIKYQYEENDNEKVNKLRQDIVNNNWSNSQETKNFANMLEKIIKDKDIEIRLDSNLKDNEGNIANGSYKDGVITINPNSDRSGEFLAIHELTHAIGTDEMRNMVQKYRESNAEFNNTVEKLLGTYEVSELNDEALADISGQLFGNQEFINNIANTKPSVFRKIYNEIKYMWHQFRGYKNQNQFINDLYYKWTEAYNSSNELNNTTNYHISKNLSNDIDLILKNGTMRDKIQVRDYTPKILVNMGLKDLPMDMVSSHIRENILSKEDAVEQGLRVNKKTHYHGLGKEIFIKAIDQLDNPTAVYRWKNNNKNVYGSNDYIVLTELVAKENNKDGRVIVPLFLKEENGKYRVKTIYRKDGVFKYLNDNKNYLDTIYEKKANKIDGVQFPVSPESFSNNSILPTKENVNNTTKYSKQESENNSGSFNLSENEKITKTINELENELSEAQSFLQRGKIKEQIRALKEGFDNVQDYREAERLRKEQAIEEYHREQEEKKKETEERKKAQKELLKKEIEEAPENKRKQYDIIQSTNPMEDDYHVGIRSPKDIKTFAEVINDDESFAWGDFSKKDAERALKKGTITVYSSKPIENGNFVSTSKIQATEYAGGGKIYTKQVPIEDVAWINGDEGQYAKISTKYSKENSTWREYLESHFKSTGTRTDMTKLPIDSRIIENRKQEIINKAQQIEKTNSDFKGLADEIKNNYFGKDFDYNTYKQMNEYLDGLNPVEQENNQIEQILPTNKVENDIERYTPTRHEVIQKNRELARENIENIRNWKDKSSGLKYQLETMERNMYDIIPDKEEAKKMIDTYFEPIHKSEAEKQKFINKYNDKIKEFKLNKYEAEAVQLLGEQKYNPNFKADEVKSVIERVNKNIENKKINRQKVDKAIETFRNMYDELFELENKALRENGYKEKPYRKGYFPHFIDYVPETKSEKILNALGFKIDKRPLPTDIAGITEQFVPGKTWNRSALERKTNKTDYNALKGFDTYIAQAADNIFHTENIQKLRALENEIRYQYSDKGVQERIDNILNNDMLYEDEKQEQINAIFEQIENPMPNLVTELRRYTNALANKKSEADRSAENKYGRSIYNTVSAIENRFGANAVGLNIGSAVTNFIPITQAWSQVSTKNMGRATIDTIKSFVTDDNFVEKSVFLTSRLRQSEKLYKTSLDKISDKTSFLFNTVDEVSSNIVVRGKYLENIEKGMSEAEAIKNADQFARNVIADRSKGALPTKFEEKNPVTKVFTQFQLEVNNQFRYMFKDIPRDLADEGLGAIAKAFFKMFVGAYIYNWASEKITGRKPAFSPIDIAVSTYKNFADDSKKTFDKLSDTATEIGEQLPFVGGLIGGGRVPVNGAIPNIANVTKGVTGLVTGEIDSSKAKDTITKELTKPLYYLLPPFGGAQIKKSVEGISTVANGGSYGLDNKGNETLQIPVEDKSVKNYVKAGLFGKYALPEAKDYTEREYKSLNANQTKMYKESNLPYKQLLEYIDQKLKKDEDKVKYLESQDMTTEQKWGIYKYDLISSTKRSDGGTQLSDAEYMINNGVSKKEYMDAFDKAVKYNIDLPTQKEYIQMKQSGLKLDTYIDYKAKLYNANIERKINNLQKVTDEGAEFDTETKESLNTKEKIKVLQNANYTNEEKKAIYSNYIDKDDKTYSILNNTSKFDLDDYLDYKQQKFESDKEDDGTINGKTVSGSAKNKFYDYMDDSNFTYDQKLLLTGMKYKVTNTERENIFDIINEFDLSSDEKLEIMSKMKGFKIYNDGRVSF